MTNKEIEFIPSKEIDKEFEFTIQKQIVTTQVRFNLDGDFAKILKNCMKKIDSLEKQLNVLRSQRSTEWVVSPGSPIYELWDNEEDDIWNDL